MGGLADWFAVTAIFRRPLGLPIPHTALIPANWEAMAERVGVMVGGRVLTKQYVMDEIGRVDLADLIARRRATARAYRRCHARVADWAIEHVTPSAAPSSCPIRAISPPPARRRCGGATHRAQNGWDRRVRGSHGSRAWSGPVPATWEVIGPPCAVSRRLGVYPRSDRLASSSSARRDRLVDALPASPQVAKDRDHPCGGASDRGRLDSGSRPTRRWWRASRPQAELLNTPPSHASRHLAARCAAPSSSTARRALERCLVARWSGRAGLDRCRLRVETPADPPPGRRLVERYHGDPDSSRTVCGRSPGGACVSSRASGETSVHRVTARRGRLAGGAIYSAPLFPFLTGRRADTAPLRRASGATPAAYAATPRPSLPRRLALEPSRRPRRRVGRSGLSARRIDAAGKAEVVGSVRAEISLSASLSRRKSCRARASHIACVFALILVVAALGAISPTIRLRKPGALNVTARGGLAAVFGPLSRRLYVWPSMPSSTPRALRPDKHQYRWPIIATGGEVVLADNSATCGLPAQGRECTRHRSPEDVKFRSTGREAPDRPPRASIPQDWYARSSIGLPTATVIFHLRPQPRSS